MIEFLAPRHVERARAAIPLLIDAGLHAVWVEEDVVQVTDGRGACVQLRVRRLDGIVDAVWRVFDRLHA